MNIDGLARQYGRLNPEERFRLILAASGRGDEAERDRLVNAGQRITLSLPDHVPHAHAFVELALLVFIELLEEAARYFDAFVRADEAREIFGDEKNEGEEGDDAEAEDEETPADGDRCTRPIWQRTLDLTLAAGFVLRTKADGWKLFGERMNVPPFLLWEGLPGFDRLQRALALTATAAFVPEGFLRWLNAVRPAGEPELDEVPLSVEGVADATAKRFQNRVERWSG